VAEASPLIAAKQKSGLTYAQIAAHLGVKPPTVHRWCHGQRRAPKELFLLLGMRELTERQAEHDDATRITLSIPKGCDEETALRLTAAAVAEALAEGAAR
jgi:transcriptional regulator with XRE-family HTH domain